MITTFVREFFTLECVIGKLSANILEIGNKMERWSPYVNSYVRPLGLAQSDCHSLVNF